MRILMIGGHGMLGEPVARRLRADGHDVRLLARSPASVAARFSDFEIMRGDVERPDTLHTAMVGCDAVHINLAGGPRPRDYDRVEHRGTANVAAAAARAGLRRITQLTGTSVCEANAWFYQTRAKLAAEQAVIASDVPYTIFRASWFMESLPLFISGNSVTAVGRHRTPLHWVAAADYASMVSRAYASDAAANRVLYIYGPDALTMNEALARYREKARPDLRLRTMSTAMMKLYGLLTMSAKLRDFANIMSYYERFEEQGDPALANRLLGAPTTRLDEWLDQQTG